MVFFFHYVLASSITNWVQIFKVFFILNAYVGIHQVRELVFDNIPKVSSAFKLLKQTGNFNITKTMCLE